MSKINSLSNAYGALLSAININPDNNGNLNRSITPEYMEPVVVEGKFLQLPNENNTRNPVEDIVLFHPLSENVLLGESPVIKELRASMMDCLHNLILEAVDAILKISQDAPTVAGLTPNQTEVLKCASGADETTIKNWKAIMRRAESRGSVNRVLTLFLKRGASIDETTYKRAGIVTFNIYDELNSGKNTVYGVKVRKGDIAIYAKVLETIIEDIQSVDKYSVGTNSDIAPYFDALVKTYAHVIKTINRITWLLRKPIKDLKGYDLHIKDDFSELFNDLSQWKNILPPQPYNEGARTKEAEKKIEQQNAQLNAQPSYQPPVQQTQPLTTTVSQNHTSDMEQTKHVSDCLPPIEQQLGYQPQQPIAQPYHWRNPVNPQPAYNGMQTWMAPPQPVYQPQPMYPQPTQGGYWWNNPSNGGY